MSDLLIDLTNYKEKTSARVDPGTYLVQVEDIDVTKSKAGNVMWEVTLRIVGGEFDGSTLLERLTHSEKAMFRVVAFLQAVGVPTKKGKMRLKSEHLIGKKLEVDVEDGEPYQGRIRSEVRGFNRVAKKASAAGEEKSKANDLPEEDDAEDVSTEAAEETQAEETKKSDPEPENSADDVEDVDLDEVDL